MVDNTCCERMAYDLGQTCDQHADRFDCPDALIAQVRGGFGLIVHDGSSSIIEISFCPWCGKELPEIGPIDLSSLPPEEE
ncbi:DUF6980 family protein [Brevundimonas sp. UBA7534]|uniref:DUF6980 family protein n=1 Tax=Brevundimonas sp. UBA7534 TaxID=1946138 RepID=UPI0025C0286D|nr:hypothetical protein [Brevundimonas sp. UBA7534]